MCGFGVGIDRFWAGLCEGRTAIRPLTRLDASGFPCRLGSEVDNFSAKDFVPKSYRKAVKVMARDIELAVGAAREAVLDAKLTTRGTLEDGSVEGSPSYPGPRMGCHIGAGQIAAEDDEIAAAFITARSPDDETKLDLKAWGSHGMASLTPLWLLKYLPNMLSCHVTIIHGCEGPSNTVTCAEASGLLSIGESLRVIERGDADLCFSGGAESKINLMGILRMDYAGRVAHCGDETDGLNVVKPYDPESIGGILGEGGGILVLEEIESATKRGAKIYAEIIGFGGGHSPMRSLIPTGVDTEADEGFANAIQNCLEDADLPSSEIDAIVVLGTGVPSIDLPEAGALRQVFGARLANIPLITLGPSIGNCTAGIGGLQAAVGAKCLYEQRLPARLNRGTPAAGLDVGMSPSQPKALRHVLIASSALGGQNAALLLKAIV